MGKILQSEVKAWSLTFYRRQNDPSSWEQMICLAGCGSETFTQAVAITSWLVNHIIQGDKVAVTKDISDQFMRFRCRYLERPRNDGVTHLDIEQELDPNNILRSASLGGKRFLYTDDNKVEYTQFDESLTPR